MAINKEKKKEMYEKLAILVKENPSVAFVNFHKMTVAQATAMRRGLGKEGVGFYVAKKTLIKKALTDAKIAGDMPALDGEIGLAYSKDQVASARGVFMFQKSLEKAVQLVGGIFEGRFASQEEMVRIASIPPRQTLLAQFVNVINSPIQGLVVALDQIAKKRV